MDTPEATPFLSLTGTAITTCLLFVWQARPGPLGLQPVVLPFMRARLVNDAVRRRIQIVHFIL
jgi:hypothetical protein